MAPLPTGCQVDSLLHLALSRTRIQPPFDSMTDATAHRLRIARTVAGAVRHDLANAAQLVLMAEATLSAVAGIPRDLPDALRAALNKIELQITRLERAHGPEDPRATTVDIAAVFEPAIALYQARPPGRMLRVHGEFPSDPPLPSGLAPASALFEAACAILDLMEQQATACGDPQAVFLHTNIAGGRLEVGFTGAEALLGPIIGHDADPKVGGLFGRLAAGLAASEVDLLGQRDSRDAMTIRFVIPAAPAS